MKVFTKLMDDRNRTVITHFLCETEKEFKKAKKFSLNFDEVEINSTYIHNDTVYYGCVKIFSLDFDEELD